MCCDQATVPASAGMKSLTKEVNQPSIKPLRHLQPWAPARKTPAPR
jgi:hypothetical protein